MRSTCRSVIALLLAYVVLLTTAYAEAGKDGCPPTCNGQGGNTYYTPSMYAHVSVGNTTYRGFAPSATQLEAAAAEIVAWANALQQSGQMAVVQTKLLANLEQALTINSLSSVWANAFPFGNNASLASMNETLNGLTQAQRQAVITQIKTYGLYATILSYAGYLEQLAKQMSSIQPGTRLLNAHFITVNEYDTYCDTMMVVGAVIALMPGMELIGGMIGLAGLVGVWAGSFANGK